MENTRTARQRKAASKALKNYWKKVRAGEAEPPQRGRRRPDSLFLRTGKVEKEIRNSVNEFVDGIVSELGGLAKLSASRRALLQVARLHQTMILLCERELTLEGGAFRTGNPIAAVKILQTHARGLRHTLEMIGVSQARQQSEDTFEDIRREYAAKKQTKG